MSVAAGNITQLTTQIGRMHQRRTCWREQGSNPPFCFQLASSLCLPGPSSGSSKAATHTYTPRVCMPNEGKCAHAHAQHISIPAIPKYANACARHAQEGRKRGAERRKRKGTHQGAVRSIRRATPCQNLYELTPDWCRTGLRGLRRVWVAGRSRAGSRRQGRGGVVPALII